MNVERQCKRGGDFVLKLQHTKRFTERHDGNDFSQHKDLNDLVSSIHMDTGEEERFSDSSLYEGYQRKAIGLCGRVVRSCVA